MRAGTAARGARWQVCAPPCSFVSARCRLTSPALEDIEDKSSLELPRLYDSCGGSSSSRLAEPDEYSDSGYSGKAAAIPRRAAAALCS